MAELIKPCASWMKPTSVRGALLKVAQPRQRTGWRKRRSVSRRPLRRIERFRLILEEAAADAESDTALVAERIRINLLTRGLKFSDSGVAQAEDRDR